MFGWICHWWFIGLGCSGSAGVPVQSVSPETQEEPQPVTRRVLIEELVPELTLRQRMVGHFTSATDAVWFLALDELGTMRAMVAPLQHVEAVDVPEDLRPLLPAMNEAAAAWAHAPDRASAADRSAVLAARCRACHHTAGRTDSWSDGDLRFVDLEPERAHGVAPYLLWLGLVLGSDPAWEAGTAQLLPPPSRPGTESLKADFERLIQRATSASDGERGIVWAELIGGCATCHVAASVQLVDAPPLGRIGSE